MTSPSEPDDRPRLVMFCNAQTPYRLALHLRIARELKGLKLISLFTHDVSNSPWKLSSPPEIGPIFFGEGESAGAAAGRLPREWRKGRRIIAYLKANRPAAIVLHGYNDVGRLRVLRWCHNEGIPVFIWGDSNSRSDRATGPKRAVKSILLKWVLSKSVGVMCCGTLGKEYFVGYGADPRTVYFVPYEPDYDLIRSLPEQVIRDTAQRFGFAPDRRRLVYSGRFVRDKRVDIMLKAWAAVAPQRPNWDLILIGDGPLRPELESLVPPAIKERTRFLGFQNDQSTISAIYRNADALCLPSEHEPWALVINEAAAARLAIVASDVVGAAAELVRGGINGKAFVTNDISSCTDALLLVTDPARIDPMRDASPAVLKAWRDRGDPIKGLRQALSDLGIGGKEFLQEQASPPDN